MRRVPQPRVGLAALLAVALLAPVLPAAADVLFSAHLGPEEVAPGDEVYLTVEARGDQWSRVAFEAEFSLINLERTGPPISDEGIAEDDGGTSRHQRLTWRLRAVGFGTAAVKDLWVTIDGRRLQLATETVRVVSDPRPRPQALRRPPGPGSLLDRLLQRRRPPAPPKVRLVAETRPQRPWAGQQVTYELWLETQTVVQERGLEQRPEFRGFWVEEPDGRTTPAAHRIRRGDDVFSRRRIAQYGVFPLRPGTYELEPSKLRAVAWVSGLDAQRVVLASDAVNLAVRPLPPVPVDLEDRWSGLVGSFALETRLLPSELAVGEAATLEVTLAGAGHAGGAELPLPVLPEGLTALPGDESSTSRMVDGQVRSLRRWRIPLKPERAGTWKIPAVEVAYFDPAVGDYRLASGGPLVMRARAAAVDGALAATGGSLLHPLRNAALPADDGGRARWRASLPWLFAAPWGLLLMAGLARAVKGGRGAGPRSAGDRAAAGEGPYGAFADRLQELDGEERPRRAALTLEAAWRDLLAVTYGVPAHEPAAHWPDHLREVGVGERHAGELGALLDDVAYLRHAPQLSTVGELSGELRRRSLRLAHCLAP